MSDTDLYSVLGVSNGASATEIKKAYKSLVMRYHPDRNKETGAEAKFKEIQQAYNVLSSPESKEAYDRFGTVDPSSMDNGGNPFQGFGGFNDLFNDLFQGSSPFSQRSGAGASLQGHDLSISVELSLEEAVSGCKRKIKLNAFTRCSKCDGSGASPGSTKMECPRCHGQGTIQGRMAMFLMQETCSNCSGTGRVIKDPCSACEGKGRARKIQTVDVNIPGGVDQDDTLRIAGKGEAGKFGGANGDLLVHVFVKPHPVFSRHGDNLACDMPVSYATAALGGKAEVPTLNGYKTIELPKGLQSGRRIKIRGCGVKGVRATHNGDLFCTVKVETPQKLSEEQANLLRKFDASLRKNPSKHSPESFSWLDKVKSLFS